MKKYAVVANAFPGFNQIGYISDELNPEIRFASFEEAIEYANTTGICFSDCQQCWHVIGYNEENGTWIVLEQIDMEVIDWEQEQEQEPEQEE